MQIFSMIRLHVKIAGLGTVVAEGQWAGLVDSGAEPPYQEGGKELALGTVWRPVFAPPRFPWMTGSVFFCSTAFYPLLRQAGGCQLPTQPVLAPWHRQCHYTGAAGPTFSTL